MKKLQIIALMAGLAWAPSVLALPKITVNDGPGNPGGLFNVVTTGNGSFQTFCLEAKEYLSIGGTYFYEINTYAKYNDGVIGNTDPISLATAYLYKNFKTISGPGIATYANDAAHNDAIQQAIWWLEGESGGVNNAYVTAAIAGAGANSDKTDANGAYGIYVMNLNANDPSTYAGRKQDLLVCVPDGGMTVALLGLGLTGLGFVSRRTRVF